MLVYSYLVAKLIGVFHNGDPMAGGVVFGLVQKVLLALGLLEGGLFGLVREMVQVVLGVLGLEL